MALIGENDLPHPSGLDRFAIYRVERRSLFSQRPRHARLAETSLDGVGLTLTTLHGEGEFDGWRIGILDRQTRHWIVNPF